MNPFQHPSTPPPSYQNTYYDHETNRYWHEMSPGRWVKLDQGNLFKHLIAPLPLNPQTVFMVNDMIREIQRDHHVDFAGQLAGYPAGLCIQGGTRILVRSGPKFIDAIPGNWDMLRGILERMFGDIQLPYLYGWIKKSLEMFSCCHWMAGQVLVLCGEPGAGKNLVAILLRMLFGGRKPGKPFSFMIGKTEFNSDFMGRELLTIEDESSHVGIQARRSFGAKIKDLAVNEDRWLHKKHSEAITVTPLQRLLISLNDDPERLLVLPPMEKDIEDKIMLFKAYKHKMPMPTDSPLGRERFRRALAAELPAFVDFLEHMPIPPALFDPRYGVLHYHHSEILEDLQVQDPEDRLLQLIDEVVFAPGLFKTQWHGKSSQLDRELKSADSFHIRREAGELLPAGNSCGKYLGRLASRCPERVMKHPGSAGIHNWTIYPPEQGDDASFDGGPTKGRRDPDAVARLLVKIKAIEAKKGDAAADDEPQKAEPNNGRTDVSGPLPG